MKVKTKMTATNTETNTAKATLKVVEMIDRLTEIRAEITALEKVKTELTAEINAIFDKAGADTLTHRNIDVARRDWRERSGTDEKKLAEMFPEVYDQTRKTTRYSVLVSLYKKATAKK
jgi:predicted phage-related endonuclease